MGLEPSDEAISAQALPVRIPSVLAVVIGMSFGNNVTVLMAGLCYLAFLPIASALLTMSSEVEQSRC
jgi:hypothetical protein